MVGPSRGHASVLRSSRRAGPRQAGLLTVGAAALAGLLLVVFGAGSESTNSSDGQFPSGELETIEGDRFDLSSLAGTPTVVNFFASWCPPCRAEMPDFQRVSQEVLGEVQFVAINTGETDPAAARELVAQTGVTFTTLVGDDGTIFEAVGGIAMPTTAFVNDEGVVVEMHSGVLTAEALRERIDEHFES